MTIFTATKRFGRFELHFEVLGAFAFGAGINAFPHVLAFGVSLGPFVVSLAYTQPHGEPCVGESCTKGI